VDRFHVSPVGMRSFHVSCCLFPLVGVWGCSGMPWSKEGSWKAIVVNGGASVDSNWSSHRTHLDRMVDALELRGLTVDDIQVLASDGADPSPDLTVLAPLPDADDVPRWVVGPGPVFDPGGPLDHLLPQPELVDTAWSRTSIAPATRAHLEGAIVAAELSSGDTLLLTTTDHGEADGSLNLWQETLAADPHELAELFALVPEGVRVVVVMSQCHSGAFARPLMELRQAHGVDICGFFSVPSDRQATGCFPELDGEEVGHAFDIAAALKSSDTVDAAHEQVLVADRGPDVPIRTSDVWIWDRVVEEVGIEATPEQLAAWVDRHSPPDTAAALALRQAVGVPTGGLSDLHRHIDRALLQLDAATLHAEVLGWAHLDAAARVQTQSTVLSGEWPERFAQAEARAGLTALTEQLAERAHRANANLWTAQVHEAGVARLGWLVARGAGLKVFGEDNALQGIVACERAALPGSSVPPSVEAWTALKVDTPSTPWLGVRLAPGADGAEVVAVHPEGPTAQTLRPGDLLTTIDGHRVPTIEAVEARVLLSEGPLEVGLADGRVLSLKPGPMTTLVAPVVLPDVGTDLSGVLEWLHRAPYDGAQVTVFVGPMCPSCNAAISRSYDWSTAAGMGMVVIEDADSARFSGAVPDPGGFVADAFGISLFPSVVALDAEQRVLWRVDGWEPGAGIDLPPVH